MTYKARLGTTSMVITITLTIVLASLIVFFLSRVIVATGTSEVVISIAVIVGIITLYVLTNLYHPDEYTVDKNYLTVRRPMKDIRIPIDRIKDAFVVRKESMKWTQRIGGNGGLFGFYGNFRNNFGNMTWYATRLDNYIMIETMENERIVLTPDNTDLAKEIRALIGK